MQIVNNYFSIYKSYLIAITVKQRDKKIKDLALFKVFKNKTKKWKAIKIKKGVSI
jgi:hypothetical protein